MVHTNFHWPNIFATVFCEFHWQFFLQWLHLNNLCRKSIAQDCMQVSWIFCNNNLTYFPESNRDWWSMNFFVNESRVTWYNPLIPVKLPSWPVSFKYVKILIYNYGVIQNNGFYSGTTTVVCNSWPQWLIL